MTYLKHAIQQLTDLVQQNMSSKNKEGDDFQWDVHVEILFLHSLFGLKPVGVNRFFTMREIHSRFSNFMQRELYSKVLWDHLDSMYDMAALHESEVLPFPNEETPFELSKDFDELVKEKFGVALTHSTEENETAKNNASLKEAKKLNTPKLKQMLPPVSNAKSTFLTPGAVKSTKSGTGSQSGSRPPSIEVTPKVKSESQPLLKSGKVKRASSPFTPKNVKPEPSPVVKEEPSEVSVAKKTTKAENNTSTKKTPKSEPSASSNSSKKTNKQEQNVSLVKAKSETSEGSSKKGNKPEKEVPGKKGKGSTTAESSSSKKSSKVDAKKTETDNHKKSSDATSQKTKPERNSSASSKSSKHDRAESPATSASKKQSAKVDINDKKRRRSKVDDSAKKAPAAKRRRI